MSVFKQSAPKGGAMGPASSPAMGAPLASAGGQRAPGSMMPMGQRPRALGSMMPMGGMREGVTAASMGMAPTMDQRRAALGGMGGTPAPMQQPMGMTMQQGRPDPVNPNVAASTSMNRPMAHPGYVPQPMGVPPQTMSGVNGGPGGAAVTRPPMQYGTAGPMRRPDPSWPVGGFNPEMLRPQQMPRMAPTPQQIAAQNAANSRPPPVGPDGRPQQGRWSPGGNWHPARTMSSVNGGPGGAAVTQPTPAMQQPGMGPMWRPGLDPSFGQAHGLPAGWTPGNGAPEMTPQQKAASDAQRAQWESTRVHIRARDGHGIGDGTEWVTRQPGVTYDEVPRGGAGGDAIRKQLAGMGGGGAPGGGMARRQQIARLLMGR